ncbi:MAG: histidine kinase dimerization/phospho-acceptor domain-containing protein, partial [Campylobacterota bacterium]|nr:histidine kinase dimerization/phospho-acceptor domain-containing protein [Campylobacterota bacterium]
MKKDDNQKLIDEIVELSTKSDKELSHKISQFIEIYRTQKKEHEKSIKQTNFFLKKWDKNNLLAQQRDLKKDKMIEQQSKMAAMGEMMDAVAHQWKQPLNAISMVTDMLKSDFKNGDVDKNYIDDVDSTINLQIDHMVNTLNEFRNFLRPSTKHEPFYIQEVIDTIKVLLQDELLSQNINIKLDIDK